MDIQKNVKDVANVEAKLSMPVWKWVAIGGGVLVVLVILAFCAMS